jgi:hypothetical protein
VTSVSGVLDKEDITMRKTGSTVPVLLSGFVFVVLGPRGGNLAVQNFQRGDANGDALFNLTDAVHTLGFLFLGRPGALSCKDAADSNDDGKVDLADAVHTLGALFDGAPPPPSPFVVCGEDPTGDALDCESYPPCPPSSSSDSLFPDPGYPTGSRPRSIVLGDLDGDGDSDLAVVNYGSDSVSVLRNQGGGTFEPQVEYAVGPRPRWIAQGDFDGDGDLDLVVANSSDWNDLGQDTVSVLRNQGGGTFEAHVEYGVGQYPVFVAVGDLDGDGDFDLAVANEGHYPDIQGTISLLFNLGEGTFETHVEYTLAEDPYSLALGDLDGDSDMDLAVANGALSILVNQGGGKFDIIHSPEHVDLGFVSMGDLDRDGDQDLVLAALESSGIYILHNRGNATFDKSRVGVGDYVTNFPLGDIDDDGDLDIVMASWLYSDIDVLQNRGDGTFERHSMCCVRPESTTLGDVDGDGDADLVVAWTSDMVSVLRSQGNGTLEDRPFYDVGLYPLSVVLGDIDGDGDADLAVANQGCPDRGGDASVLRNQGNGIFEDRVQYTFDACPNGVALGDFDGDSDADLALADGTESTQDNVRVLWNMGSGTFEVAAAYHVGRAPTSPVAGDLDGDGDIDLAVANEFGESISVLLNRADGTFEPSVEYTVGDEPISVALGDLNGDGKADLAVANRESGTVSMLRNLGDGTFATFPPLDLGNKTYVVAIGDLDGDADRELIVGQPNSVSVFRNRGDGGFEDPLAFPLAGLAPHSIALGDLDGDGDSDIAAASGAGIVSVLRNRGDGTFEAQMPYGIGGSSSCVVLGDLDADGDADLVIADDEAGRVSILLNRTTP